MSGPGLEDVDVLVLGTVDRLVASRLTKLALEADADRRFPQLALDALQDHDLLTIGVPEAQGGVSGGLPTALRVIERLAATAPVLAALPAAFLVTAAAGASGVGLRTLAWGHEPDGASPVIAQRAGASGWTLDGLVEGVDLAGSCAELVVTALEEDGSVLVVQIPANATGITVGPDDLRTGLRGMAKAQVRLSGVQIDDAHVVGGPNEAAAAIRCRMLCGAATSLGSTRAVLAAAVGHLGFRTQFGVPLSTFSSLRAMVTLHWSRLEADAARLWATCPPELASLAGADLRACVDLAHSTSALAVAAALDAIQLHGGYGYVSDQPVERLFRDAVSLRAGYGTGWASDTALEELHLI